MIYKQNGKILVTNGKLAASENCCCGVGFCCYCLGPGYYFLEAPRGEPNDFNTCRRSFGGIYFNESFNGTDNGESLNTWSKTWRNDSDPNQYWYTFEDGSQYVPPGYTH